MNLPSIYLRSAVALAVGLAVAQPQPVGGVLPNSP